MPSNIRVYGSKKKKLRPEWTEISQPGKQRNSNAVISTKYIPPLLCRVDEPCNSGLNVERPLKKNPCSPSHPPESAQPANDTVADAAWDIVNDASHSRCGVHGTRRNMHVYIVF